MKKFLLLAMVLVAAFAATAQLNAWDGTIPAADADYAFSGGDGSAEAPYQIASAADLAQLAANVNGKTLYAGVHFVQTADIDLNYNEWTSIGNNANPSFQGNYDGDGHAIKGMSITVRNNYAGLFGFTKDAVIENLSVVDVDVNIDVDNLMCAFGIIVGDAQGTVIRNCSTSGNVLMHISANKSAYVGGFVGMGAKSNTSSNGNTIVNCHSSANIISSVGEGVSPLMFYTAGISGQVNGVIKNCYYDGKMTYNYTPAAKVYSSAISANPNGSPEVSGNFYALAEGSSEGICGVSNSAANTGAEDVSSLSADEIAAALNAGAEDMAAWEVVDGKVVIAYGEPADPTVWDGAIPAADPAYAFSGGDGSAEAPYQIASAADLAQLAANVNGKTLYAGVHFVQTADIDIAAGEWPGIGNNANPSFQGNYDGDGHAIKGMSITVRNNYAGLFGFTKDAVIENLSVVDVDVNIDVDNVMCAFGIIAGDAQGTVIRNCSTSGNVLMHISANKSAYVGGFVGMGAKSNTSGNGNTIVNCHSSANIISSVGEGVSPLMFYTAGISGQVNGVIKNCYYDGKMTYNYTPAAKVYSSAISANPNGTPEVSDNFYALAEDSGAEIFGVTNSDSVGGAENVIGLTPDAIAELLNTGAKILEMHNYGKMMAWVNDGGKVVISDSYIDDIDIPGDLNGDGEISIADVVLVCNLILNAGYDLSADLDGDGSISVADVVALVNQILSAEE